MGSIPFNDNSLNQKGENTMYRLQRTGNISRGKALEARQWAKEVAEYINKHYAPVSVQAYSEIFGDIGRVHWYADAEDLATIEGFNAHLLMDQGYQALINKSTDLFVEGSIHDRLIQSL